MLACTTQDHLACHQCTTLENSDLVKHAYCTTREVEARRWSVSPKVTQLFREELGEGGINNNSYLFIEHWCIGTAPSPLCIFSESHDNEIGSVTITILQTRLLKLREVKWLVQSHTASQLFNQHFNLDLPDFKAWQLTIQGEEGGERERKEWNIY